jgi:hypothetical protein
VHANETQCNGKGNGHRAISQRDAILCVAVKRLRRRLGSGEPVSDGPLIAEQGCAPRPRQSAAGRNGCAAPCLSRSCRAGPPAPCPHTARHGPGRFGPARPGYFFVGRTGRSPTRHRARNLRWSVCISAVPSPAKRSTSASKANWGRCCGFDEARFTPAVRYAARSTIGASATPGSPKRHDLTPVLC